MADARYPGFLWIGRVWRATSTLCFLGLSLRFFAATLLNPDFGYLPPSVLAVGSAALGYWRPRESAFAFSLMFMLLHGLGVTKLLQCPAPATLVFIGVFFGSNLHYTCGRWSAARDTPPSTTPRPRPRESPANLAPDILAEALIGIVLISLIWQWWKYHLVASMPEQWWREPAFGYGDQLYFVTAAFVWLQGLYYFKLLRTCSRFGSIASWVNPAFISLTGIALAFYFFQLIFDIPKHGDTGFYASPFEEFHAFGSVAVAILAFILASRAWIDAPGARHRNGVGRKFIAVVLWIAVLVVLLIGSWSRTAWLTGGLLLLALIVGRLRKIWVVGVGAALVATFVVVALAANESWRQNRYLGRLLVFVQPSTAVDDLAGRADIFRKAAAMMRDRPLTGHGIGSFYLTSGSYARPADPASGAPNFAHNFALQIGAELGLPALALFLVWLGLGWATRATGAHGSVPLPISPPAGSRPRLISGLRWAMAAYFFTQLTSNSINIFTSNQYFCMFLLAALFSADAEESPTVC